ncbi:hypothetical protein GH714_042152 [Hevea brasiliensis]|uniref:Uncharacterized protein n=1 Tax=Hevea brasiliensis TaxID=3981 RepID=A0A6A6MSM0_HEVBR|nr:hypothetical protein GH714_042152 [Hevea brasiliensis]
MESFESNWINEDHQINNTHAASNTDHGWQKVTYTKRNRKQKPADSASAANAGKVNGTAIPNEKSNVFRSLEQQSEERRRRIIESQRAAIAAVEAPVRSKHRSDDEDEDEDDSDDAAVTKGNEKMEEKKVKQKKPKKPKVTVAEAAAKIDSADLAAFLADISASYEGQQEIQLMRFADYFGRAFSSVSSAQFPWVKFLRENTVAKMTDIPLSHISDAVYKTSVDFINQRSIEALGSFVLWSLDSILADLASQQVGSKSAKKGVQHVSSKSQVAIFVVLAMVLRRKPDALVNVLPMLRESSKYQGQDKLPVVAWMIAQVSQGDLAVGLYSWAHNLLPINFASPKACTILVSGAVRKGERLVPPFAYEILLRVTFPASSARVKATERFEAVYPILREVALAGSTGSKAMKQDKVYEENPEASIAILKKLSEEWKEVSVKLAPLDPLRETLKNFRQKNEKALAKGEDSAHQAFFRDADKYCKLILGKYPVAIVAQKVWPLLSLHWLLVLSSFPKYGVLGLGETGCSCQLPILSILFLSGMSY